MFDNETADGAESHESYSAETDNQAALKSELESLRKQNEELMNKFNSFLQTQTKPAEEKKAIPPEDFKKLLDTNPQEAIEVALAKNIEIKTRELEAKLNTKQQTQYWDQKAEQDFPMMAKDKAFADTVRQEMKELVDGGMNKDSPKLIYTAAKIAALKHKGSDSAKSESKSSVSSEAPNTVKKSVDSKHLPKNFDRWSRMFGLSDKAKEKAKENFSIKAETEQRRGRRY